MNTTTEKKTYETPQLTVVSFKVEQGYAESLFTLGRPPIYEENVDEIYGMQDYDVQEEQHWF